MRRLDIIKVLILPKLFVDYFTYYQNPGKTLTDGKICKKEEAK